jgi:hypothetical protein
MTMPRLGPNSINVTGVETDANGHPRARVDSAGLALRYCAGAATGVQAVAGREVWVSLAPKEVADLLSVLPLEWFTEGQDDALLTVIRVLQARSA